MAVRDEKVFSSEEDLKKQADAGDAQAQELCGLLYDLNILDPDGSGIGRGSNRKKSKKMYKKAAKQGSPTAQIAYGELLVEEEGEASKDAQMFFDMASDNGFLRLDEMSKAIRQRQLEINVLAAKKILIVEDNKTEREMLSGLIKKKGFGVEGVSNGLLAEKTLAHDPHFSLIILDMNMPLMDGIDFLKRLRSIDGCSNTPVIVLSGDGQKNKIMAAKKLGVGAWIVKPLEMRKLDKVLGALKTA